MDSPSPDLLSAAEQHGWGMEEAAATVEVLLSAWSTWSLGAGREPPIHCCWYLWQPEMSHLGMPLLLSLPPLYPGCAAHRPKASLGVGACVYACALGLEGGQGVGWARLCMCVPLGPPAAWQLPALPPPSPALPATPSCWAPLWPGSFLSSFPLPAFHTHQLLLHCPACQLGGIRV